MYFWRTWSFNIHFLLCYRTLQNYVTQDLERHKWLFTNSWISWKFSSAHLTVLHSFGHERNYKEMLRCQRCKICWTTWNSTSYWIYLLFIGYARTMQYMYILKEMDHINFDILKYVLMLSKNFTQLWEMHHSKVKFILT